MKWLKWIALAFLIYYVVNDPAGAAALFHQVISWLQHAAHSLATFANGL